MQTIPDNAYLPQARQFNTVNTGQRGNADDDTPRQHRRTRNTRPAHHAAEQRGGSQPDHAFVLDRQSENDEACT